EPHGIRANTVLPFGLSRMVTETLGDSRALTENGFFAAIRPELVAPIVVFLASRACDFSHQNFSACAGRFARVFVGLSEGWLAPRDSDPTAEDIAAHLAEVTGTQPFAIPGSIYEEVFEVTRRLGVTG
ncbi:short-chain dehydrogenase, partial [Mycolicibacterium pulveris]